jgi:ribose/xylose/arabinose/galactoside ABC-type transport system permease subunit
MIKRAGDARVDFILGNVLVLALLALVLYFTSQTASFLTSGNIETILVNDAPLAVVVVGLTLLVICGHVDLSIGSNAALSALICTLASTKWGVPNGLALLLGVLTGGAVGAVNGVMCAFLRFNPIVVTLGMLGVVRGSTLLIDQNQLFGLGGIFNTIGSGDWLGIPAILWFVVAAFALGGVFITLTPWGRHIYAIGANPQAAFLSALPVRALPFALYVATGAAAGLSGVLFAARLDGISPGQHALNLELQALTVVLLGGVAFAGGRGRLFGVLIAWLFLATLQDGLVLLNVTPYVQQVASGAALVFAAALDALGAALTPRLAQRRRVAEQVQSAAPPDDPPLAAAAVAADPPASPVGNRNS